MTPAIFLYWTFPNADAVESFAAQTEGDTGYDYNDIYDEDYEEESGMQTERMQRIRAIKLGSPDDFLFQKLHAITYRVFTIQ